MRRLFISTRLPQEKCELGILEIVSPRVVSSELQLRTGVWHADNSLSLPIPAHWEVTVFRPATPPPLSDSQIERALDQPAAQPPLRELCRQRKTRKPLIIVDDPNRPTPAFRVLPSLLRQFQSAGIAREEVSILVATGTHGAPRLETVLRKLGPEAASCPLFVHDSTRDLVDIGRTSRRTPVGVNRYVTESDFVVGVGGIYPNHQAGYGGGTKIALGALGLRTIAALHSFHKRLDWGTVPSHDPMRKDLDEIARLIGLASVVSLQIDGDGQLIRMAAGDPTRYYAEEVAFARQAFRAPAPSGADVVISNAYPNDLSVTFVHKKGIYPLRLCSPGASRIVIAACSEGHGLHQLFPYAIRPHFYRLRRAVRRASLMSAPELAAKLAGKLRGAVHHRERADGGSTRDALHRMWLYRTVPDGSELPTPLPDMRVTSDWDSIVRAVEAEQGGKIPLKVYVYPCAPLQVPTVD